MPRAMTLPEKTVCCRWPAPAVVSEWGSGAGQVEPIAFGEAAAGLQGLNEHGSTPYLDRVENLSRCNQGRGERGGGLACLEEKRACMSS